MYCIKCDRESDGKFCKICGRQTISSQKEWMNWQKKYSDYSQTKLEDIISHKEEYREDAGVAAQYMYDTYVEETQEETAKLIKNDMMWYFAVNGKQCGPVTESALIELVHNEQIGLDTYVWRQGFTEWVTISQSGLNIPIRRMQLPPPLVANQVNNKAIVFLLFVPVIATLIQYFIAGLFQIDVTKLWWIAYGLNVICCTIDYYKIKNAGYNANKLRGAFLFLVPLYIYKRMELVKGKKWLPTIIWTMVFVADLLIPATFWVKAVGMSNPAMITSVKDGSFYGYADITVGRIFDEALDDCEWDTYMGGNRRVLVQVTGEVEGYHLDTVFELKLDSSFDISYMSFGGNSCSAQEIRDVIEYLHNQ